MFKILPSQTHLNTPNSMTESQKNQVTAAVTAWISDTDQERSQNKLCQKSGVAPVILAAIRRGEAFYKPNQTADKTIDIADVHYIKLAEALGLSFERTIHFQNSNYAAVFERCQYLQAKQRRGILDSTDSGAGKTYALEAYAAQHSNVLYIKATSLMKGRDLIEKILTAINARPESKSMMAKLDAIARKVIQPGYLIIIDEMESVSPDMWRVIKDIEDATYRKIGFMISGKDLSKEIKTAAIRGKKLMPQIWRRFKNNILLLKGLNLNSVTAACREHGITDLPVIRVIARQVEDWAQLNEWIKDIHDNILDRGLPLNPDTLCELFEIEK